MKKKKKESHTWDSVEKNALKNVGKDLKVGKHTFKILAGILIYFAVSGIVGNIYLVFNLF